MNSLILKTTARFLQPMMLLFSLFLLMRGHNEPGGGFIGGLVAAGSFAVYGLAFGPAAAQRLMRIHPRAIISAGLLLAIGSGLAAIPRGRPFLSMLWTEVSVPGVEKLSLGTALLFDSGVYLTVLGVTMLIILTLAEEE